MKVLYLNLKGEYFDAIVAGTKSEEYRLYSNYWIKRLNKEFDEIELMRGYPSKSDTDRRLRVKWNGYTIKTITHKHFGVKPVQVFALKIVKA